MSSENNYTLINNDSKNRYEFHMDGLVAFVQYTKRDNKLFLVHTEVPKGLEGRGIASALVTKVLEEIESRGLTLVPLCPYIQAYLKRHPEWNRLVK
jgi:predicted GNAT family acetyltransferase